MSWEPQLPIDPVKKAVKVEGVAGGVPIPVSGIAGVTSDIVLHDNVTPANYLAINASGQAAVQLPPGAATAAKQDTGNTSLASIDGKDFATQTTLALIKAKTDNLDVALSTRTKPADTQKVDGSAVTQPVSGPLTDAQLRASAVPISASQLPAALDASGFLKTHEQGIADVTPAKATAAVPTYTEGTKNPLSVDLAGNLRTVSVGGTTYFPLTESSTYDGVSATLTLGHTPTDEPRVFIGGLRWYLGVNYSRVGAVITWISIPVSGETIQVDYTWSMASSTLNSTLVVDVSGNVQPTGDTSARPIHVAIDTTLPISVASLPLPTGAATELTLSKQRQAQELALLVAIDSQRLALASRSRERISLLSQSRGSR